VESVVGVTECVDEVNVVDGICGETVVVGTILGKTYDIKYLLLQNIFYIRINSIPVPKKKWCGMKKEDICAWVC
jgi:hypothetical protein